MNAEAIVAYLQDYLTVAANDIDLHVGRARMAMHIGERFLQDAEQSSLDRARQPIQF
jgi:hypothetical protein